MQRSGPGGFRSELIITSPSPCGIDDHVRGCLYFGILGLQLYFTIDEVLLCDLWLEGSHLVKYIVAAARPLDLCHASTCKSNFSVTPCEWCHYQPCS